MAKRKRRKRLTEAELAASQRAVESGGAYTTLDDPSATNGTTAFGINATGQIVGAYGNATGTQGFLLSGGTYTTLDDPLATNGTAAFGINGSGQIVGYFNSAGGTHGFVRDANGT